MPPRARILLRIARRDDARNVLTTADILCDVACDASYLDGSARAARVPLALPATTSAKPALQCCAGVAAAPHDRLDTRRTRQCQPARVLASASPGHFRREQHALAADAAAGAARALRAYLTPCGHRRVLFNFLVQAETWACRGVVSTHA